MKFDVKTWLHKRGALPALCYLAAAAVWLVLGVFGWAGDALARAQGRLRAEDVALEQMQLVDLAVQPAAQGEGTALVPGATLVTTSGDPQMILEDVSDRVVRTVSYAVAFAGEPREMCLYYTTKAGQEYSADRRVYPEARGGKLVYTLPRGHIVALRLDPCSPDANRTVELTFAGAQIQLNAPETLPAGWRYLCPSWYQAFCLLLYPGLAAAAISWLAAVAARLRRGKAQ